MQSEFENRKKVYLDWRVKQRFERPPIGLHPKKGTTFSRHYAQQTSAFAFLKLSYGQNMEEANTLIRELCDYFLNNPDQLHEPHSFYWATEFYLGIYHSFSWDCGDGALTKESEVSLLEMMWQYLKHWSEIEKLKTSLNHHTLWYWLSENHWFMELVSAWAFAHILIKKKAYKSRTLDDQFGLREHLSLLESQNLKISPPCLFFLFTRTIASPI